MKKRRIIFLTSMVFPLLMLASCTSKTTGSTAIVSEVAASEHTENTIFFDTEGKKLSYQYFSIENDFENHPVILLHFEYTNDTDISHMVSTDFFPTVYQNGVELKTGILQYHSEYLEEYNNLLIPTKEQTIPVCFVYSLQDLTSDVEVHMQTFLDFFSEPQKMTLSLVQTASDGNADENSTSWEKKYYALLSKYRALQQKYEQLEEKLKQESQTEP